MQNKLIFIFTLLSLAIYTALQQDETSLLPTIHSEEYYQMEDFGKVKKFDVHIHINTEEPFFYRAGAGGQFSVFGHCR